MKLIKVVLLLSLIIILGLLGYWYTQKNKNFVPVVESSEGVKTTQSKKMTPMKAPTLALKSISNSVDAQQHLTHILKSLSNGDDINLKDEKQLIKYLRAQNNPAIYSIIFDQLTMANSQTPINVIRQQYLLSFLAAIKTVSAAEVLLSAIDTLKINDASTIYVTKKSIMLLGTIPANLLTLQHSFTQLPVDNKFLGDIALSVAQSAQPDNLEFLLSYFVGDDSAKSNAVKNSLSTLGNERLVPILQASINNNRQPVVITACLDALANMGQYQATSALISWSTRQSTSAKKQVERLFTTALNRSPSAFRAIEKELNLKPFESLEIKRSIVQLSHDLAVKL
jgi:hypothetical protein